LALDLSVNFQKKGYNRDGYYACCKPWKPSVNKDDLRPDRRSPACIRLWVLRVVTCSGTLLIQSPKSSSHASCTPRSFLYLSDTAAGSAWHSCTSLFMLPTGVRFCDWRCRLAHASSAFDGAFFLRIHCVCSLLLTISHGRPFHISVDVMQTCQIGHID
jgi:hypothetical protein